MSPSVTIDTGISSLIPVFSMIIARKFSGFAGNVVPFKNMEPSSVMMISKSLSMEPRKRSLKILMSKVSLWKNQQKPVFLDEIIKFHSLERGARKPSPPYLSCTPKTLKSPSNLEEQQTF